MINLRLSMLILIMISSVYFVFKGTGLVFGVVIPAIIFINWVRIDKKIDDEAK